MGNMEQVVVKLNQNYNQKWLQHEDVENRFSMALHIYGIRVCHHYHNCVEVLCNLFVSNRSNHPMGDMLLDLALEKVFQNFRQYYGVRQIMLRDSMSMGEHGAVRLVY